MFEQYLIKVVIYYIEEELFAGEIQSIKRKHSISCKYLLKSNIEFIEASNRIKKICEHYFGKCEVLLTTISKDIQFIPPKTSHLNDEDKKKALRVFQVQFSKSDKPFYSTTL